MCRLAVEIHWYERSLFLLVKPLADRRAGSLWASWVGPSIHPTVKELRPEDFKFNFYDDVGNLELDHTMTRMDGVGGAME